MVRIINHKSLEKAKQKFDAWKLFEGERTEIVRVHLKPAEQIEKHINPVSLFFFVLSGKGQLILEGEYYQMKSNEMIYVSGGLHRSWQNNGTEELQFLVIKEI